MKDYKNRNKQHDGWMSIARHFSIAKGETEKTIANLKNTYLRDLKKERSSTKKGVERNTVFVRNSWILLQICILMIINLHCQVWGPSLKLSVAVSFPRQKTWSNPEMTTLFFARKETVTTFQITIIVAAVAAKTSSSSNILNGN